MTVVLVINNSDLTRYAFVMLVISKFDFQNLACMVFTDRATYLFNVA